MNACQLDLEQDEASCQDSRALEELWQKLDANIRQSEFNLRRLMEQKVRVEYRIVSLKDRIE